MSARILLFLFCSQSRGQTATAGVWGISAFDLQSGVLNPKSVVKIVFNANQKFVIALVLGNYKMRCQCGLCSAYGPDVQVVHVEYGRNIAEIILNVLDANSFW